MTGSTFNNNSADFGGAGIHIIGSATTTTITNSTITQNTVVASQSVGTERGGGVVVESGDLTLAYDTIVGNSAPNGSNIASDLGVSLKTVDSHRSNLMEKLDIHKVSGLVRFAIRAGMVEA